jgi:hypothetical protein
MFYHNTNFKNRLLSILLNIFYYNRKNFKTRLYTPEYILDYMLFLCIKREKNVSGDTSQSLEDSAFVYHMCIVHISFSIFLQENLILNLMP